MERSHVTAADIARIAQVSRTTVSNWRRRHEDFPAPIGGTGNRAVFDRAEVEKWLADSGRLPEREPHERLWEQVLALAEDGSEVEEVLAEAQELLLALARGGPDGNARNALGVRPGGAGLASGLVRTATTPGRSRDLSDLLHSAYLAHLGGKAHITPEPLAVLMADLAGARGTSVLDPACGTGGLLRAAADQGAVGLYGQELVSSLARLTRTRVAFASPSASSETAVGDALTGDGFPGREFGAVLCNPPFNQRDWGADRLAYDERWAYGVPPRAESELAWTQHCLAHTLPGGRVVVLMPPAAASRPSGRRIRGELVRRGVLRAVVGLPAGAAAPVHVELQLWVLCRPGAEPAPDPRVLFVDTAADVSDEEGERRPVDWEKVHRTVTDAWSGFLGNPGADEGVPGLSRAVPVVELLDDTVDLTPARHLPAAVPKTNPVETRRWAGKVRRRLLRALEDTRSSVPGEQWTSQEGGGWQMATVADLARSGALTVHQAAAVPAVASEEGDGPRVLTLADVLSGAEPSKRLADALDAQGMGQEQILAVGDVVVPSGTGRGRPSRIRVVGEGEVGAVPGHQLYLVRPDPAHIDPWFLAGFLADEDNLRRASQGSTVLRLDLRRLRVPLLPPDQQQRYGAAFRRLHEFRTELERARRAADELEDTLAGGMRAGLLLPPSPTEAEQAP